MVKKFLRTSMALAAMASVMTMSTVASAESVRPGQSVVSAEQAAKAPSAFKAQRAGADMKNANQAAPQFVIFFFVFISTGFLVYKFVRVATETFPESP